jgi:mannonate dehydratase
MDISLVLPPEPDNRWELAQQVGVKHAVFHSLEIGDGSRPYKYDELLRIVNRYRDYGIEPVAFEGSVPLTDKTRLGLEGRDEEIERFCTLLRNLGELGVTVVCYDWMAGLRWARTSVTVPTRGDALTSAYNNDQMRRGPTPATAKNTTREDLWRNLEYFLKRVVPVAEEVGVYLSLHPDDPPIEDIREMPRIIGTVNAYDRVLDLYDSPHNGITFCQGNFSTMGVDIPNTIRHFSDRINFVHFRDVDDPAADFTETWHDSGPTDMKTAKRTKK